MNIRDLVGRRCLVTLSKSLQNYRREDTQEVKIIEVSPSGQWTKVQNLYGTRFWLPTSGVALVEVLTELVGTAEPKP